MASGAGLLGHRQRGRTLVELMVVLALGLLILLGVGTLYLTASRSSQDAERGSVLEDSGRAALRIVGDSVRRAYYSEIANTEPLRRNAQLYGGLDAAYLRGCTGQHFNTKDPPECETGSTGDALLVAFQANNVLTAVQGPAALDCLGNAAPDLATATMNNAGVATVPVARNVFYLANGRLMCLGNGNATPQPIVDQVTNFRVFFGFDDRYRNAAVVGDRFQATSLRTGAYIDAQPDLGRVSAWNFAVSVLVCLELRGPKGSAVAGELYQPCPAEDATSRLVVEQAPVAVPDSHARRTYVQTFAIRSQRVPTLAE